MRTIRPQDLSKILKRKEVEQAESVRNCIENLQQENRELTQVKKNLSCKIKCHSVAKEKEP
ncbi:hypothetical protein BWX37_05490 [Fusobacterium necrophorum subsp. funduliforme]|nr:hypothetical protein BWX37_05490 [Fusobacterium necrophorum subsp. funduliforme]